MPGGYVNISLKDANNTNRTHKFFSSNGFANGVLQEVVFRPTYVDPANLVSNVSLTFANTTQSGDILAAPGANTVVALDVVIVSNMSNSVSTSIELLSNNVVKETISAPPNSGNILKVNGTLKGEINSPWTIRSTVNAASVIVTMTGWKRNP